MRRVIIAIVNGVAQSGKTTIQDTIIKLVNEDCIDVEIEQMSSVSVPYKIMGILGWNGVKDDQFRADMAALKQMYIRHCNGPVTDIIRLALDKAVDEMATAKDCIIFSDMREASEIKKMVELSKPLNTIGIECKTVMIRRDSVESIKHDNPSDDAIIDTQFKINYDIVVENNGDINTIRQLALGLVEKLMEVNEDGSEYGRHVSSDGNGSESGGGDGTGCGSAIIQTAECG